MVEFLPKDEVDLSNTVRLTNRVIKGCLGLILIDSGACLAPVFGNSADGSADIFLALVTSTTEIGNTRPSAAFPESVARIHEVCFYSLTSSAWDDSFGSGGDVSSSPEYPESASSSAAQLFEHPCMPLTKIMSSGSFYYALDSQWDLSSRLSHRLTKEAGDTAVFDERFVWNDYIVRSLLDFRERLSPHERDELDQYHFIASPRHLRSPMYPNSMADPCHSRLRRDQFHGTSDASNGRKTLRCHSLSHLAARGQACWNSLQHSGCR